MLRRVFLEGTVGTLFGGRLSKNRVQSQESLLRYPLISTAEDGTRLNDDLSENVRTLAEYVITKPDQEGLLSHVVHPNDDFQHVEAEMKLDGKTYTVIVANYDESQASGLDTITIHETYPGDEGTIKVGDRGLSGRSNFGVVPVGISITGRTEFNDGSDGTEPSGSIQGGFLQAEYRRYVRTLMEFYGIGP